MSNDKTSGKGFHPVTGDNAYFDPSRSFGEMTMQDDTAHEPPHGHPFIHSDDKSGPDHFSSLAGKLRYRDTVTTSDSNGDYLYWDGKGFRGELMGDLIDGAHDLTIEDRKKMGLPHLQVYETDQELKDIIFQTGAGENRVFFCANEWLVRFGQDQARVWGKNGIKLCLCAPCDRIPEPPTYADIRKD